MKLNLGAGSRPIAGYVNIDRCYGRGTDADPTGLTRNGEVYPVVVNDSKKLAGFTIIKEGEVDEIRASHVLEHFPHGQTLDILTHWACILAPGCWLKIAVPDFAKIAQWYLAEAEGLPLEGYCMGGQTDENDFHKAIFDERSLRRAFAQLGLVDIQHWTSEIEDCAALPV